MMSILEAFAYGELKPAEDGVDKNPRYKKAMRALQDYEKKLSSRLDGKDKALFNKFLDLHIEVVGAMGVDRVIHGYRLGLLMLIESIACKDSLLQEVR